MIGLFSIIAIGFFRGMRHATDPDHVVAVTTIVSRHRSIKHAAVIGALWGLGQTVTILIVGGGIIYFGWIIPARIGLTLELSVGLMLIFLGILNLTGILRWITEACCLNNDLRERVRRRLGIHGNHIHILLRRHLLAHSHERSAQGPGRRPPQWFDRFGPIGAAQVARSLVVGLIHGLAGSAAVALLVVATVRNPKWAVMYLVMFGVGTIAGMMLITGAMVVPFAYADSRFSRLNQGLWVASGILSVGFGLFLTYEIGVVNGLFSSHPQWTPR